MNALKKLAALAAVACGIGLLVASVQQAEAGRMPNPGTVYRVIPAYGTQTFNDVYHGYSRVEVSPEHNYSLTVSVVTQDGRYFGPYTGANPDVWWDSGTTGTATVTVYNPNPFPVTYVAYTN